MDIECGVGDCIYFDDSSSSPYGIGRIEELRRGIDNGVLVKIVLYFRKRDIPYELMSNGEKNKHLLHTYDKNKDYHNLSAKQKCRLKQRELFCSCKTKVISASLIKGKCYVTFLNDAENLLNYTHKEDTFFYSVTFTPKFLAERGEIHVGKNFQASIPPLNKAIELPPSDKLETLMWTPENDLSHDEIDKFLKLTRLVETLPRAANCPSIVDIGDLVTCAGIASRDAVLFHGMNVLHQHHYNYADAEKSLLATCDQINVSYEIEKWTHTESKMFELGYSVFKKDFERIRTSFLPWKSHKEIVEYYYNWKTTDDYVRTKELKTDNISRIKIHVKRKYEPVIANYKNNSSLSCAACHKSLNKYGVTLTDPSEEEFHLCPCCWLKWKKYG